MLSELPVAVVTVTYNSAAVISGLLASIPAGVETIVVDNASSDGTPDIVARSRAQLVRQSRNPGFGAGCNAGARIARREFLFFVNPDAAIEAGAVEALIACARANPSAVAFNPQLIDDTGRAVLRAPSRFGAGRHRVRSVSPAVDREVDVLSGAALFCRREAFERIGGFDESIFLYFEDDDLCLRLLAGGGKLMHVASARVRHHQGDSTAPAPGLTRLKNYHWMRSYRYVAGKHGHAFPAHRIALHSALRLAGATIAGRREDAAKHAGRLAGLRDPIRPAPAAAT